MKLRFSYEREVCVVLTDDINSDHSHRSLEPDKTTTCLTYTTEIEDLVHFVSVRGLPLVSTQATDMLQETGSGRRHTLS